MTNLSGARESPPPTHAPPEGPRPLRQGSAPDKDDLRRRTRFALWDAGRADERPGSEPV